MKLIKQPILPGFENGAYERRPEVNRAELLDTSVLRRDPSRRGNHVNVRLSTQDLEQLHQLSLQEGLPVQSLIANIVRAHLNDILDPLPEQGQVTQDQKLQGESGASLDNFSRRTDIFLD